MQQFHQPEQAAVRPVFRLLGAVVLLIIALVLTFAVLQVLNAPAPTFVPGMCTGKGRLVCELGNLLSAAIPDPIEALLEIGCGVFLALLALYGAVRLIFPRRSADSSRDAK